MDDYDTKSLQELYVIAKDKYNVDIPPEYDIKTTIEWLRDQDMLTAAENTPIVPTTPKSPMIPVIPGLQNLPKGDGGIPIIAPVIPTLTTVPVIPKLTVANIAFPAPRKYYLNEENTLRTLYGNPALDWNTDFATFYDINDQEDLVDINPNAAFQRRVLHPDYRPRPTIFPFQTTLQPVPTVAIPGLITIPPLQTGTVGIGLPIIHTLQPVPTLPTAPIIPIVRPTTPIASPRIPVPTLPAPPTPIASPKIPVPTIPTPTTPIVRPTTPIASPRIPVPTLPIAIPTIPAPIVPIAVPTIPKPIVPIAVPTIPKPIVPIAIPTIPKPVIAIPTIPKPVIAAPTITTIPRPTITTLTVATPTIPVPKITTLAVATPTIPVPKITTLTVARPTIPIAFPIIPQPTVTTPPIAFPTIPKPTVTTPPIAFPTIPKPTATTPPIAFPTIPKPGVTTPPIAFPTIPGPGVTTMNIGNFTFALPAGQGPIPNPFAERVEIIQTPGITTLPQPKPASPQFIEGPQMAGYTAIRTTNLTPTIPNLLGGQRPTNPTFVPAAGTPKVTLPTFNTVVTPITPTIKRPAAFTQTNLQPNIAVIDPIMQVLNEIDPELLVSERTGKNKKGYSLTTLQGFAHRLGLATSGKRKQELIDNIQAMRRERGLL